MAFPVYKEDEKFELPCIENGVIKLGDLWDCQSSRALDLNLFNKSLDEKYLEALPIPSKTFRLDHLRTAEDKLESLNVYGELPLELLAGFVKVKGSASFDVEKASQRHCENLTCRYYMTNFCVDVLPQAKEVLNELVVQQLMNRNIKATHVVKKVIIGADIDVNISVEQIKNDVTTGIKGDFFGKITFGSMDTSMKASLKMLDSSEGSKYDKKIVIYSKPPLKNPKSIEDMFKTIQDIDTVLAEQNNFKQITEYDVIGVPIRYILVPISQYIDVPIEKLYKKLKEETITKFTNMLATIRNFSELDCIRSRVFVIDNRFRDIVNDKQSNLSIKIAKYEKEIITMMLLHFKYATEALRKYKVAEINESELLNTVAEFEKSFSVIKIFDIINEFVAEEMNELSRVSSVDAKQLKEKLTFFSTNHSMDEWFRSDDSLKILLKTGGVSPDDAFLSLCSASDKLASIGIHIGIALPSVDPTVFSLSIKVIGGQTFVYDDKKDIIFVLKLISATFKKRTSNEKLFYEIYTQLTEEEFSLNNTTIEYIPNLVSLLNNTRDIKIAKSEFETLHLLRENDNRWKFFVPLDAIDTAVEAIDKMRFLLSEFRRHNIDWIIGSVNIRGFNSAPLLFIIRNQELRAICTDYLDILILVEMFTSNTTSGDDKLDLDLLSVDSLNDNSFYGDRMRFAEEFINIFGVGRRLHKQVDDSAFTEPLEEKTHLNDALDIIRCILREQYIELASCIARIGCRSNEDLVDVLLNHGWDSITCRFRQESEIEWTILSRKLQDWLMNRNPFLAKVYLTCSLTKMAIESNYDENEVDAANAAIDLLKSDSSLSDNLQMDLEIWDGAGPEQRLGGISHLLKKHLDTLKSVNIFHVYSLIDICTEMSTYNCLPHKFINIGREYIDRIPYAGNNMEMKKKIERYFDKRYLYQIIKTLNKCANSDAVNMFSSDIEKLININDEEPLKDLLNRVCAGKDYNESQLKYLWQNKRFLYMINSNMSDNLIETLAQRIKSKPILNSMPTDIHKKIEEFISVENKFEIPEIIQDLVELKRVLQYLIHLKSSDLPPKFLDVLNESIVKYSDLKLTLEKAGSMTDWNEEGNYFSRQWDLNTVMSTLKYLDQLQKDDTSDQIDHDEFTQNLNQIPNLNIRYIPISTLEEADNAIVLIDDRYHNIMGNQLTRLMPKEFVQVMPIQKPIELNVNEMNGWVAMVMPYIIQRLKMWGCNTLLPENISRWIIDGVQPTSDQSISGVNIPRSTGPKFKKLTPTQNKSVIAKRLDRNGIPLSRFDLISMIPRLKMWVCNTLLPENISRWIHDGVQPTSDQSISGVNIPRSTGPKFKKLTPTTNKSVIAKRLDRNGIPLSRFDLISGLLSSIDIIVAQDLLRIMSKFPISLPLIIHDITKKDKSFICLLPPLVGPTIKWEISPGHIVEHELFGTDSEFHMIVAVRLGNNSKGKSTILNQILATNTIFSRCGEPGAMYGKPSTLDGSVEFVWLLEETCSAALWQSIIYQYSHNFSNKIILLANLHGNALEYPDQLKLLTQLASSFIVFIMPDIENDLESYWQKFTDIIGDGDSRTPYICVDPSEDSEESEENKIFTTSLTDDNTLNKVRQIILNAILNPYNNENKRDIASIESFNTIQMAPKLETTESQRLVDFIKKRSCQEIRKMMEFQSEDMSANKSVLRWKENTELQQLISLYAEILVLPLSSRRRALIHIEREIGQLFNAESLVARSEVTRCREELQRTLKLTEQEYSLVRQCRNRMNMALRNVDDMSLGLEHFFRELAKLYQCFAAFSPRYSNTNNRNNNIFHTMTQLSEKYAELLIEGHTIELLNGDTGEISGPWLAAIFNNVSLKYPNLRVFVISIIGLQSSGKSTLLNALFGCKFAVSVGRCTRGLFLRLLFLNEEMRERLEVDAFLLIDTEGLGAPEKMNDTKADQKDRLLATFAIGVSNLIIINVLGEYMNNLVEILQIAIVTMARLEEAKISPDIMLVQHMGERNEGKIQRGLEQFREALDKAFELADKKYMDVGIKNFNSLSKLMERIQTGQLLHQFPPFKSGASVFAHPSDKYHEAIVHLYDKIIAACNSSVPFNRWHKSVKSYWDAVSREDFSLRFKNIKQFYEFLERGTHIAKIKEHYEYAFRHHVEEELKPLLKSFVKANEMKNSDTSIARTVVLTEIEKKIKCIPMTCKLSNDMPCAKCKKVADEEMVLFDKVANSEWENDTRLTIKNFAVNLRQSKITAVTQMFYSMSVQNGCSLESIRIIDNLVKIKLESGWQFGEEERMAIVDEIWTYLKEKTKQQNILRPVGDQIKEELVTEYEQVSDIYHRYQTERISRKSLLKKKAYEGKTGLLNLIFKIDNLTSDQINALTSKIDGLPDNILRENKLDHYETGMVSKLKYKIEDVIQEFEKKLENKLKDSFKWDIHLYGLQKFAENMIIKQEYWDNKNEPLNILCKQETYYRDIINTRLKYGYSLDGEGIVIGDLLLKGIAYYAKTASDATIIDKILNTHQLSNAQNIRLMYFSDLARSNDKKRVLRHFWDPEASIEDWFVTKVNSFDTKEALATYLERFEAEYDRVLNDINDPSKDIIKIKQYVSKYLERADGLNYDDISVDSEDSTDSDISLFRESMLKAIKDENKLQLMKTEITFKKPSEDDLVMKRLGCTDSCPLCTSLCWGARDHYSDKGDTSKHHTSHQPFGLAGVCYIESHIISYDRCGENDPDTIWHKGDEVTNWKTLITKYHSNWKFQQHA